MNDTLHNLIEHLYVAGWIIAALVLINLYAAMFA